MYYLFKLYYSINMKGTAGNTGIGLAYICRAKGYKCIIYIPETQAIEKVSTTTTINFK